jgi:hypothetical protein
MDITIDIDISHVLGAPGPSGGASGLLLEDMTGGASPTPITTGFLLLEDGSFLLLE